MSARFHVVGGGIAGLAAAWELSASEGVHVTVHEASDRWGGKVHTTPFAGHPVDEGADAFLLRVPWALELARELGLEAEIVHPAERRAYIWSRGDLRPMPAEHVLGVPLDLDDLAATWLLDDAELAETRDAMGRPAGPVTEDDLSGSCGPRLTPAPRSSAASPTAPSDWSTGWSRPWPSEASSCA